MSSVVTTHVVDADGLANLRRPRRDLLVEETVDADTWAVETGPFRHYRRTLEVAPAPEPDRYEVTERTIFSLAIPLWWPLLLPLMKRALRDRDRRPRGRWWWPMEVVPSQTSNLVAAICVISVMSGYLGVIIGQTITFAAEDFGDDDGAQANTLAGVRIGVLLSLLLLRRADRYGRRPLVLNLATGAIVFTVLGSLAPSLLVLGGAQTISRGLTTGLITLLVLAATEEVPSSARAFAISLVTVCAALGAGMVVWVLPVADVVDGGWRIVYMVPVVFLPALWWVGRHLPETRRFHAATALDAPASVNWYRFALIGATAFASALFFSPASQLRNEFLRDDLGYSATLVSVFQLVISAPAGTAIVIAGIVADRRGRRWIGAIGVGVGAICLALSYRAGGAGLWLLASGGVVFTGAAFPALRGYQTELFPTRSRAKVGGMLDVVAVAGSATGLVLVGYLSERWDDLGSAIGVMVFAPLAVAAVILLLFPETARRELEAFNPDDPDPDLVQPDSAPDHADDSKSASGSAPYRTPSIGET